jgi:acyl carrier protein
MARPPWSAGARKKATPSGGAASKGQKGNRSLVEVDCEIITEIQVVALSRAEIEEKVIKIVSDQMGVDKSEINMETSFVNDLNADSLDTVELVMEFEDAFEMSIPDEEAEKIQTVGHAVDYIMKVQGEKK